MAVTITVEEVKDGFVTSVPDAEIQIVIDVIAEADACLDKNSVSDNMQRLLKLYAIRHMLWVQSNEGRGSVTSESAPSGASRSYGQWRGDGSPYWGTLKQLDRTGCVRAILDNTANLYFGSIGPSYE